MNQIISLRKKKQVEQIVIVEGVFHNLNNRNIELGFLYFQLKSQIGFAFSRCSTK